MYTRGFGSHCTKAIEISNQPNPGTGATAYVVTQKTSKTKTRLLNSKLLTGDRKQQATKI